MSYLGSHRPRLRWFRVALALFTVLGLFAAGAVPAALAHDDEGDEPAVEAQATHAGGRYRLEIISASCTFSASGTTYDLEVRAGRTLRHATTTLRLLDATSGISVLATTKPAAGRLVDLEGSVAKKVGRMGLGFVDARGDYLKLVTVRCTAA